MDSRQLDEQRYRSQEGAKPATAGVETPVSVSPATHATILIAENEENNRHLMEQILKLNGYSCLLAANGRDALRALEHERVDLVLIDLSMPVLDGYRTTELIRQRPGGATLPIVAVTAHAMGGDRERAFQSGCTEYLVKPFRPRDLVRLVERLLQSA
jgi:CheY-like chemotaxis protein